MSIPDIRNLSPQPSLFKKYCNCTSSQAFPYDIGPFTAESVASGFESEVLDAFALE
jgi:hypothetical protein